MRRRPAPRILHALAVSALAAALLALSVAPTLAGGVAVVVPIPGDGSAVDAGEPTAVEFTLLQHGRTPVDFGAVTVVITNTATGETVRVPAARTDRPGGFRASFAFPEPGWWAWHAEHDGLLVESAPTVVGVMGGELGVPTYGAGDATTSTTSDLARSLEARVAERAALDARAAELSAQLADAQARTAAAEGRPTTIAATVGALVAAIAGLLVGLGLGWLAGRPRPVDIAPPAVASRRD